MDLYVRYWDIAFSQIKVRYFESSFLGHGTSSDILGHFSKIAKDLNTAHLYQLSVDGPNVHLKFTKNFVGNTKMINITL